VTSAPGSVFATRMPGATPKPPNSATPGGDLARELAGVQPSSSRSAPLPVAPDAHGRIVGREAPRAPRRGRELLRDEIGRRASDMRARIL
jgi:hypothetical protein